MGKRFFDTKLHKKPWFRNLRWPLREAFRIHCAEADEIGIWEIDMDSLNFQINAPEGTEPVTLEEMVEAFDFQVVEGDKLWNPHAVSFQFGDESGEISSRNKLLPKVLRMLKARGLPSPTIRNDPPPKGHRSPIDGVKEKEQDKEKEEEQNKEQEISAARSFENRMRFPFGEIWDIYPRNQKKSQSLALMAQKIYDQVTFDAVKLASKHYRDFCERERIEHSKILTFPSFWNEWRDWLDPENGKAKFAGKDDKSKDWDPMTVPLRGA